MIIHSIFLGTFFKEKHWIPKYEVICLMVAARKIRMIMMLIIRQPQKTATVAFSAPKELYLHISTVLIIKGSNYLWKN